MCVVDAHTLTIFFSVHFSFEKPYHIHIWYVCKSIKEEKTHTYPHVGTKGHAIHI